MAIIKHNDQRVGFFIDTQNLYHSAKNLYNDARVNFGAMGGVEEWECAPLKGGCGHRYRGAVLDDLMLAQLGD